MHALVTARHYAADKTAYTHFVAVPAARDVRSDGVESWVERHWLHGPFVGVAVAGPAVEVVRASSRLSAALEAGVQRWPSTREMTSEQLEASSERNGRLEQLPGPYTPIYPDNTVQILTPDRTALAHLLGGEAARDTRDTLMSAGLDALDVATGDLYAQRMTNLSLTITALALHATTYAPGPTGGAMSFLSHVEDYLHRSGEQTREAFERAWLGAHPELVSTVAGLLAGQTREQLDEVLLEWSSAAVERAGTAYRAGALPLLPAGRSDDELSDFHRFIQGRFDPAAVAEHFGPYRFATNVLYQLLLTCGVRPVERYLGAYLLSRCVTALTGVDWVQLARSGAGA